MTRLFVILFALFVAVGRLTIETRHNVPTWGMSYEAIAHLFVGGIFAAALITRAPLYWWIVGLLTVWEVVCFKLF